GGNYADSASAVVVQPDGKTVIVGQAGTLLGGNANFGVVRLNADGTLDASFGTGGKVVITVPGSGPTGAIPTGVGLGGQGRIIATAQAFGVGVAGSLLVARLGTNGALDASFSGDGLLLLPPPSGLSDWEATDLGFQANGQIVVAGMAGPTGASAGAALL